MVLQQGIVMILIPGGAHVRRGPDDNLFGGQRPSPAGNEKSLCGGKNRPNPLIE